MTVDTYTKAGAKATTAAKLDPELFAVKKINQELLHQAYSAYLANGRVNLAVTKTRGLVRGGGRKPWRQKGTGRARVGSSRTPVWRGGGIVFGPTGSENYTKKINAASKRTAIIHALSNLNAEGKVKVIEDITLKGPKVSELNKLLSKIDAKGYTVIAVDNLNRDLTLASRNVPNVKVIAARYLNVARLLDADTLVITKEALETLSAWLNPAKVLKEVK